MGTSLECAGQAPRRSRHSLRRANPSAPSSLHAPHHLHEDRSGGDDDAQPECPVCMTPYAPTGGNTFAFPCGHCVCTACDARLRNTGYLACPTCREPRVGTSRAQVDAASVERVRRDELRDQWGDARAVVQGEAALTVAHNGSVYELLFFPDQSAEQRPYDVLRTVQSDGVPSAFSRVRVGEHRWHEADDAEDAEAGDAPAEDAEAHVPTDARRVVALPAPLAHMVHELLRPHNLPEFLRRHDALTMLMRRETGGGER